MKKIHGSSNVDTLHYDSQNKTLEVKFHNGGVYVYSGVPQEAYDELEKAESVGSHLHKHIKLKYKSERKSS